MKLDELVSHNLRKLNPTDLIIWRYIYNNKKNAVTYLFMILPESVMFQGQLYSDLLKKYH